MFGTSDQSCWLAEGLACKILVWGCLNWSDDRKPTVWPWFFGTPLNTGGGVCTGFYDVVKIQLHPIVTDVDPLVKSTQEIGSNQQHLQFDHKHLVQTVQRMDKDDAAAFDRLIKTQEKVNHGRSFMQIPQARQIPEFLRDTKSQAYSISSRVPSYTSDCPRLQTA